MIPTTLSASSTSTASNIGNSNGSNASATFSTANTKELVVGIASLILEGRAFIDDEFHMLSMRQATPSPPRGPNTDNDNLYLRSASPSLSGGGGSVGGGAAAAYAGRQSPKPSTSKAANSVQHLINITTNPHHAFGATTAPLFIETPNSYHSSSSAASSAESTHQRWTQKLCQLRQASPAASLTASYEQKVAIEAAQGTSGEPELVSLAIHDPNTAAERGAGAGDFEIVRRVMLSRSMLPVGAAAAASSMAANGSASSSPGSASDNFLHSLQSLATTCLRGGSPSMDTTMGYHYGNITPSSGYLSMDSPKYAVYRALTPRFQSPFTNLDLQQPGSASSSGSGVQSPKLTARLNHNRTKELLLQRHGAKAGRMGTPTSTVTSCSGTSALASNLSSTRTLSSLSAVTPTSATPTSISASSSYPQQGPHCDQFLRKMGLAKGETAEAEDHYCDMSYVKITCYRWRAYCLKMEAILERCEPICIEVYLGPIGHKVLLEQWIFTFKEKVPPPTMTLPSLCSAIRSQLYFSQISAWCDLIRKSDKSIYDTGRVIFATTPMMGCAGDLATSTPTTATALSCTPPNNTTNITPGSSPNSTTTASTSLDQLTNAMLLNQRPRLNLFYRIKQYDATACFNSKPTIHNFPNVNISENCSISVCLKSLPRINGGIPKLGTMMSVPGENVNAAHSAMHTTTRAGQLSNVTSSKLSTEDVSPLSRGKVAAMSSSASTSSASSSNGAVGNTKSATVPCATNSALSNCDKERQRASDSGQHEVPSNGASTSYHGTSNINRYNNNSNNNNCQQMIAGGACAPRRIVHAENVNSAKSPCTSTMVQYAPPQKCTFFIDESELGVDGDFDADAEADADADADIGDADDMSDNALEMHCSNGSCGSLSHREKQLLKYRKRMLKRDKKQQQRKTNSSTCLELSCSSQCQPMEQGDDDEDESEQSSVAMITARHIIKMISTGTQTPTFGCCQHCGNEKSLVCLKCSASNKHSSGEEMPQQDGMDEMDACSVNSMSSVEIISTPRSKGDLLLQAIQRTPKAAKHKQKQAARAPGAMNGESSTTTLNPKLRCTSSASSLQNNNHLNSDNVNGVTPSSSNSSLASVNSGCQVCKRQKTQHNFSFDGGNKSSTSGEPVHMQHAAENDTNDADGEGDEEGVGGRNDLSFGNNLSIEFDKHKQTPPKTPTIATMPRTSTEIMDEECFISSTKLTPHFDRCALSSARSDRTNVTIVPMPSSKSGAHAQCQSHVATFSKRSYTPPTPLQLNVDCEFKTPSSATQHSDSNAVAGASLSPFQQQQKSIPKPNLLQVACVYKDADIKACCGNRACSNNSTNSQDYQPLLMRKGLPKVNLTPIFCSSSGNDMACSSGSASSYNNDNNTGPHSCSAGPSNAASAFSFDTVTINRVKYERAAAATHMCTANNNNNNYNNNNNNNSNNTATTFDNNAVPVQKSYSAPTLPNSPSLSPRFAKQAAIYKRRSRHLSDRSDRSSLGSDEQYSDEDLDCGGVVMSGAVSPMKQRARLAAMFNRQPLLGNLEECLLQKRITPKTEVNGFKVLLGASGGFCPTQLTIPAASYFYELHGESLSTPYVCEIRLPRKGYSVPRTGTIQATLLNPLGTVVRMFVIPYDMRDMPPLHQTFIRQRILADTSAFSPSKSVVTTMQTSQTNSLNNRTNNSDVKTSFAADNTQHVSNEHGGGGGGGGGGRGDIEDKNLGHFISAEHMKRLRYSIHLRFQTSRSGRLMLHTDIRLLISRRTDCDTAAAHAKGLLEAPNELVTDTVMPSNPKYSVRQDVVSSGAGNSSRI